jgi:hypothetical protein
MSLGDELLFGILRFFGAFVAISLVAAFPVEYLWNLLMPALCAAKTVGYWQAFGLVSLGGCLTLPGKLV